MTDSKKLDGIVNEILAQEAEWQRLDKACTEAFAHYNEAVVLKDKLPRPTDREVELAKGYASLIVKSVLSAPQNKVDNIALRDYAQVLSVSNMIMNDSWLRELFGPDAHWFHEVHCDVIMICISGKAIFDVEDYTANSGPRVFGVMIYKDRRRPIGPCYTCDDVERAFEQLAKEVLG